MILIHPKKATERKVGNIIVPATVKEKSQDQYGTVVAVGAATKQFDMPVEIGDEVLFMDNPTHIEVGENKLMHIEHVLMVL